MQILSLRKAAVHMGNLTSRARAAWLALALLLTVGVFASGEENAVPADASIDVEDTPPLIALTFDDGPMRMTTPELLDGLSQRGVRATFFLVGNRSWATRILCGAWTRRGIRSASTPLTM